jgi:hypothetical protein
MAAMGPYDSGLQMFVQERRSPDMRRLRFLRWLAEGGRLEHEVAGAPSGELSVAASSESEGETGLSEASSFARLSNRATRVNADLGKRFVDSVQFGNHAEGSQSIRFRK